MPMSETMLIVLFARYSPQMAPISASGSDSMMANGSL